jgi:uncharacterized protein (DUF305 family)
MKETDTMERTDQERDATVRAPTGPRSATDAARGRTTAHAATDARTGRRRRSRPALGLALLALAAPVALAACGSEDEGSGGSGHTGHTATAPSGGAATATTPTEPTGVDRAFAAQMVPHHAGAVEMAEIARERGSSAFVRGLAGDVIRTQRAEIDTLRRAERRLAAAGVAEGDLGLTDAEMGMDHDVAMLRDADDVDRAFLEMMIPHHEGAIAMAQVELARGGDPELRRLAQRIADAQQGEIDAMRGQLGDAPGEPDAHDGH